MTEEQLIRAIHAGIRDANKTYANWSDGISLSEAAVEGFMVAHIAQAIMGLKLPPAYLCLEYSITNLKDTAGRRPPGRPAPRMNDQGRVDVALFNGSGWLTHVIEAKCCRAWSTECDSDIERLANLQRHLGKHHDNATLRRSIFALFIHTRSVKGKARAEENLERVRAGWEKRANAYCQTKQNIRLRSEHSPFKPTEWLGENGEIHLASSICFIIKSA